MNDIWVNENGSLEYYGECLNEFNSSSYLLVIESYLLKSMSSINMNLANKYKVLYFLFAKYLFITYLIFILRNHFWKCSLKKALHAKLDQKKNSLDNVLLL